MDMNRDGIPDILQTPMVARAPSATVGLDTTGDGRSNYFVSGVDMNRDGIPDVLQSPQALQRNYLGVPVSNVPTAIVGLDSTGDGRANYLVSGVDMNRDGIPDILQQSPQVTTAMRQPWNQYPAQQYISAAPQYYSSPIVSGSPYGATTAPVWAYNPATQGRSFSSTPQVPPQVASCRNCGHGCLPTDKFCPACGTENPRLTNCPACGADVKPEYIFCSNCGINLQKSQAGPKTPRTSSVKVSDTDARAVDLQELQSQVVELSKGLQQIVQKIEQFQSS
jgi:hypothetical protein